MANKLVTTQIIRYQRKAQAPLEIRHRRCLPCLRQGSLTGQATLELALAIVCIFILLLGSLKIFLWVNQRLVLRQEDYESNSEYGRVKAGSSSGEVGLRESSSPYPKLNIFGN